MSNNVWPVLPGLDKERDTLPSYSSTIHQTANGKEYRTNHWAAPRYRFRLRYNGLRSSVAAPSPWGAYSEVAIVRKFLDDHYGSFDSFLYDDDGTQRRVRFAEDGLRLTRQAGGAWWSCEVELVSVL